MDKKFKGFEKRLAGHMSELRTQEHVLLPRLHNCFVFRSDIVRALRKTSSIYLLNFHLIQNYEIISIMIPPIAIPSTYDSHRASKVDNFIEFSIWSILFL